MAIKKGIQRPEDKKNTPNDPGRQAVPQRPADKKVTNAEAQKNQWQAEFDKARSNGRTEQRDVGPTEIERKVRKVLPDQRKEQLKQGIRERRGGSGDTEGIIRREFQRAHTKK